MDGNRSADSLPAGRVVSFIRIQKTGGTTWGEVIMPAVCAETHRRCFGRGHADYEQARGLGANPALVTLLRHPVERALSEFFYMRTHIGRYLSSESSWDFQNETFLRLVQDEPDDDKALDSYLHAWPENPSFNRQVLYLAGFKGWWRKGPFRWTGGEQQQREFLSLAKQHLAELHAFGFTDCYMTSVGAMASALGWDEARVTELAASVHKRKQSRAGALKALARLARHLGIAVALKEFRSGVLRGSSTWSWRSQVDAGTLADIERLNWADMELYNFALGEFRSRFGRECAEG